MDPSTRDRYAARARVIKAMAHPSRLLIVEELGRGERCVGELQELVGADMSTVSRHLGVLRDAGVIAAEKRGNQVFHRLRVPCVLGFFACVESVLQSTAATTVALTDAPAGKAGAS
jgi:ArsR family transcriptional regulator